MTVTLAINEDNDIYLDAEGNIAVASGIDAVLMVCKNVSQTRLGEMALQTNQGLPMEQALFVGRPNISRYESALRNALLGVDGVIRVLSISIVVESNIFKYAVTILTKFGQGIINGDITPNL